MRSWRGVLVCVLAVACGEGEPARSRPVACPDGGVAACRDVGRDGAAPRADDGAAPRVDASDGGAGADVGPVVPADPDGPLAPRVENETCRLPEAPPVGAMAVEEVHPALDFERPLWFGYAPDGSDRRYVVEQGGRILVFDDRPDVERADVFLDLRVSRDGNEEGLLGLAFHPRYAENGRFFVYYSAAGPRRSIVSEFRRDPDDPRRARPDSERVLLEVPQPFSNHNGGDLRFGPDGYLYVSLGDGGAAGDPHRNGQDPTTLLGAILRIDVDAPDPVCGTPYRIPADNPFAAGRCGSGAPPGGRPEVWAWGLRNVWRMSFDRATGELWAGDVGQDDWEEIDVIEGGRNYGWNRVEGERCYVRGCDPSEYAPPVHVYPRSEGRSVTGGFVYRGAALPELWGAYVFGDYASGRVWALRREAGGPARATLLAETGLRIASFGEDPDGELYLVTFARGRSLLRLVRRDDAPPADPFPERLSETGCFTDTATHTVAPGVIPYEVNAPLWSDGALKRRYFALPPGETIAYRAEGPWDFPVGTVLIKTFEMPAPDGGPARRVETRLLRRGRHGWQGFSYRWNEAQDDAVLLPGAATAAIDTPEGPLTWEFPSRAQCQHCHVEDAGFVLGPTTRQLNRAVDYGGVRASQLAALAGAGYVRLPASPERLPAAPAPDDEARPVADRARAVLDANCAMCHRPDGPANARIDLRATTPLADTGLCDAPPDQGDLGIDGARLIAPGDPARSILLQRMLRRGPGQMPPLATRRVDGVGTTLVGAWIQELGGCP